MIQPQRGAAATIRDRDQLYSLIISQLFYDGHQELAVQLVAAVKLSSACPPSDRLQHVVRLGMQSEADQKGHQLLTGKRNIQPSRQSINVFSFLFFSFFSFLSPN